MANRESILSVELKNVSDGSFSSEESLKELGQLVDTAGLTVVGSTFQKLATPNPMTYIGSGKVAEIKTAINALDAEIVIFDDELQQGNIRSLQGQPHGGASSLHCDAWISLCIFALDRSSRSCIVVTSEHDQYHLGVKVPEKKLTVSFWLHLQVLIDFCLCNYGKFMLGQTYAGVSLNLLREGLLEIQACGCRKNIWQICMPLVVSIKNLMRVK